MPPRPGYRRTNYDLQPSQNPRGPQATEPHSPWQLEVEKHRAKKSISIRELASKSKVPAGTMFNWLRAKTGSPPTSSYTPSTNQRLAAALGIKADSLWELFNKSIELSAPAPVPRIPRKTLPANPSNLNDEPAEYNAHPSYSKLFAFLKITGKESFTLSEIKTIIELLGGKTE